MSCDNFMHHLAPDGRITATDLESLDQAATKIILDRKAERRQREIERPTLDTMGNAAFPDRDWMRESRIMDKRMKRLDRGGSTMRPGDGIENY